MSKDTLHGVEGGGGRLRGSEQQLKLKKRRGTDGRRRRLLARARAQTPSELRKLNWFVGRGSAANRAQIGKNETLIALIRRNAGVEYPLRACRMQQGATSSSIPSHPGLVAAVKKDDL